MRFGFLGLNEAVINHGSLGCKLSLYNPLGSLKLVVDLLGPNSDYGSISSDVEKTFSGHGKKVADFVDRYRSWLFDQGGELSKYYDLKLSQG